MTVHMKDIGISIEHISIIYAVLPFTVFFAPSVVGYLADKLGSYTRVLLVVVASVGVFHTLLLAVPKVDVLVKQPETSVHLRGNKLTLSWDPCFSPDPCADDSCATEDTCATHDFDHLDSLILYNCSVVCDRPPRNALTPCDVFDGNCTDDASNDDITLGSLAFNVTAAKCTSGSVRLYDSDRPETSRSVKAGCELRCQSNSVVHCEKEEGNRHLTNGLYFLFRMLGTMGLACSFVLLDAQTIQMCKVEEENGRHGALGRQYVFNALAQAIISPIIGKIMDAVSRANDGQINYLIPFLGSDVFLIATFISIMCIKLDLHLPPSTGMQGVKKIFKNFDIIFFLFIQFVLGCCFGFVETFLFIYLKEDMGATMMMLGLTITVGALVSIPFLFFGDWIVNKVGRVNMFIIALLMYGVRYLGYSYISDPWMAFPFEALEVFTLQLMRVATSQYVGIMAPRGLLATLNGMTGGAHFGFGKGSGGLLGGAIISITGDTAFAFRVFGIIGCCVSVVYFVYEYAWARHHRHPADEEEDEKDAEKEEKYKEEEPEKKVPLITEKPPLYNFKE